VLERVVSDRVDIVVVAAVSGRWCSFLEYLSVACCSDVPSAGQHGQVNGPFSIYTHTHTVKPRFNSRYPGELCISLSWFTP